jgi:hypothetical protein
MVYCLINEKLNNYNSTLMFREKLKVCIVILNLLSFI